MLKKFKIFLSDIKGQPLIGVAIAILIGALIYVGYTWTLTGQLTVVQFVVRGMSMFAIAVAIILAVSWSVYYLFEYVREFKYDKPWRDHEET